MGVELDTARTPDDIYVFGYRAIPLGDRDPTTMVEFHCAGCGIYDFDADHAMV